MPKYVMPPRQKMINLIYIVLIAMLGINISQDALEGYDLISSGYRPQIALLKVHNKDLQESIKKEKPELEKTSLLIREKTDSMQKRINALRARISQAADRDKYQDGQLINRDNMDIIPEIMLSLGQGKMLKQNIETYKKQMKIFIGNKEEPILLHSYLNTTPLKKDSSWEKETFAHLPVNAGITVLHKLEEELLTYEKEILLALLTSKEETLLESETELPLIGKNQIYINGKPTDVLPDGTINAPMVQVSTELTPMLYRGVENQLQFISVGITGADLKVTMTKGRIIERNGQYWAIPNQEAQTATIVVSKKNEVVARYDYLIKELPEPIPYVAYTDQGKQSLYKGNVPFSKSKIQAITELVAHAPEGPKVKYNILSFETVFIKSENEQVITLRNKGNKFSEEQRRIINQLQPGDKFYITSIIVSGGQKNKEQIASINIVLI